MLSLAQHIGSDECRIGGIIGDYQDLAGSGNHVDVHFTEYHLLGKGHEYIAWTDDLIDLGYASGPVSHCPYSLSATYPIYFPYPEELQCRHDIRIDFSARRRYTDSYLLDPRNLRRDHVHQHR